MFEVRRELQRDREQTNGSVVKPFDTLPGDARGDESAPEIIGRTTSIRANTECVGECRIGAVAPMSDTLRVSGAQLVSTSSRDRITVDMRGMKGVLEARARQLGIVPSELVRTTLAGALGSTGESKGSLEACSPASSDRVRLCLRIRRSERDQLQLAAKEVGLTLADLMLVLLAKPDHRDTISLVKMLSASNAELAALSRSLSHLARLLGQGSVRAALAYRDSLDRALGEVRAHLKLAAAAVSDLQPLVRLARQRRYTTEVHDE